MDNARVTVRWPMLIMQIGVRWEWRMKGNALVEDNAEAHFLILERCLTGSIRSLASVERLP
jgi:hypothetical protein